MPYLEGLQDLLHRLGEQALDLSAVEEEHADGQHAQGVERRGQAGDVRAELGPHGAAERRRGVHEDHTLTAQTGTAAVGIRR